MGYLVQIILALGALGLAESGFASGAKLPILVPFLALVPQLLGRIARRSMLAGQLRRGASYGALLSASPPALFLTALSGFGWHESVWGWLDTSGSLFGWPDLSVFTVLMPFVLFQVSAIDAKARVHTGNEVSRKVFRGLQLRMFFSSLTPAALYVLLCALVGLNESVRISIEEVALLGSIFSVLVLAVLAVVLPTVLRSTWDTEPFPDSVHRELLARVAQLANFQCREVRIWRTGNLMANAAIIGLGRRSRYVLFSDALLSQLELRELAAVFAHEIGHAMRRHVPVFLAWTIAFFLVLGLVGDELELLEGAEPFALVGGALFLAYWGFGYMSRRFELDADLYAMQLLNDPEAMIGALEKIGGRLRDVAGWRHFSVADRVAFLRRASADPGVALRLRRVVRRFAVTGSVLLLLALFAQGWALLSTWDSDQLNVDLRLGRYEQASERIARDGEPVEGMRSLVEHALGLVNSGLVGSERELTSERLADFARAALAEDNREFALRYLELATLRGADELIEPVTVLYLLRDGEIDDARELAETLEPGWRAELAPLLR